MIETKRNINQEVRTKSYDDVVEALKSVPTEYLDEISRYIDYLLYRHNAEDLKIRNLKTAIADGENSGIYDNFDAQDFLSQLKRERGNG